MAVELEGLEFQIETKSDEATKGVNALSSTFSKLKKVTKGGLGLNSSVTVPIATDRKEKFYLWQKVL